MKLQKITSLITGILFCLMFNSVCYTQSGRATESPTPSAEVSASTEAVPKYPPCEKGLGEVVYLPPKKIQAFVEELNELGNCGYRMVKAAKQLLLSTETFKDLMVAGVVRLDAGNKYEYDWFEARTPSEIVTRANLRAEKGFYFRQKMMYLSGRCGQSAEKQKKDNEKSGGIGDLANLGIGSSGSVFLFERKNGIVKKNEYRVLDGSVKRGDEELAQNQKTMDEYISRGFRPVETFYLGLFSAFAVIMEKDDAVKPEGEYRLLKETYGINKKLTEFAKEGFNPLLIGFSFAVLHRTNNQPRAVSYDSANGEKELKKKLSKWQQQGAVYQANGVIDYDDCDVYEGKLYFAVPDAVKTEKPDYRILTLQEVSDEFFKKRGNPPHTAKLKPEFEKFHQEKFQEILKEGYVFREIIFGYGTTIIFERSKM